MIAELEKDPEFQAIFANLAQNGFKPTARYDQDGDCIEFFSENVAFNGIRLDDWITMYVSESDGRLVGCQVKRIKRLFREYPDLEQIVLVQDNKMRSDLDGIASEVGTFVGIVNRPFFTSFHFWRLTQCQRDSLPTHKNLISMH